MGKCSEVLQCSDGPSNKVSNIIRRHTSIDNISCSLYVFCYYNILSYSLVSFFVNRWLYSCLILQFMYFYCKVYVFLLFGYPD